MHLLDIITIISAGLMTGTEVAFSAFVNPGIQRLESGPRAQAISILGRSVGRAMPVWYILCFALLVLESLLRQHQTILMPLLTATAIWAAVILFSISVLVPLNNRVIASLNTAAPAPGWERDHRKWEVLHRIRILLLIIALLVLIHALVA